MASDHPTPKNDSRETLYAILAAAAVAIVLGSLLTGSPFHAIGSGYSDYSREPPPSTVPPDQAAPATAPSPASK